MWNSGIYTQSKLCLLIYSQNALKLHWEEIWICTNKNPVFNCELQILLGKLLDLQSLPHDSPLTAWLLNLGQQNMKKFVLFLNCFVISLRTFNTIFGAACMRNASFAKFSVFILGCIFDRRLCLLLKAEQGKFQTWAGSSQCFNFKIERYKVCWFGLFGHPFSHIWNEFPRDPRQVLGKIWLFFGRRRNGLREIG